MKMCCCRCKYKQDFFGIFSRKPGNLAPLDGLRAVAVLWVVAYHSIVLAFPDDVAAPIVGYGKEERHCLRSTYLAVVAAGDLGFDIFFVVAGFLIALVLLKECDRQDGQIDIIHFYRNRFLRLWPAEAVGSIVWLLFMATQATLRPGLKVAWSQEVPILFFLNNLTSFGGWPLSHLWSVAVEFQFYLISPCLILFMYNHSCPWLVPLALYIVSAIIGIYAVLKFCEPVDYSMAECLPLGT